MLRVGLTGGIGSGKSTVAGLFQALGTPLVDTDLLAREAVLPGAPALDEIRSRLGEDLIAPDGRLDRRRLRERTFREPRTRQILEEILHPRIRAALRERVAALHAPYCLIAIPLLVEKGWQDEVDRVLVVDAEPEAQIARVQARDGTSRDEAERILASQASREERVAAADDVISNNGSIDDLREQVRMLHQRYLQLAHRTR